MMKVPDAPTIPIQNISPTEKWTTELLTTELLPTEL